MSAEENKALIRRFTEVVWNGRNADALDAFHPPEFIANGSVYTTESFKQKLQAFFAETPDFRHTTEDIVAEGDKVAYRWIMQYTDKATGKHQVHRGITFNRIVDRKIVEDWYNSEQVAEA
jgi:predicted ester cyclase